MISPLGRGLDALLGPTKTKIQMSEPTTAPTVAPTAPLMNPSSATAIPVLPYKPLMSPQAALEPSAPPPLVASPEVPVGLEAETALNETAEAPASHGLEEGQLILVPLQKLKLSPFQPRREFDPTALAQLASSIKQHGLIQPIVVIQEGDNYILVAGERRYRACQLLGLADVPAILKEAEPNQRLVLALVENLQRKDLNTIEKAEAYQKLVEMLGLTHGEISEKLGVSKGVFSNTIRFLKLPAKAQEALKKGQVAEGQMLTMMSSGDEKKMLSLLEKFLNKEMNMNEVRAEVSRYRLTTTHGLSSRTGVSLQLEDVVNVRALEEKLGVRAGIKRARNKAITISLTCHDETQYKELMGKMKNLGL